MFNSTIVVCATPVDIIWVIDQKWTAQEHVDFFRSLKFVYLIPC